jgi:hypothetical protein
LINGIPSLASRADLADRSIVLVLPSMRDTARRKEEEFWKSFDVAAPRILGSLLDGLSGALRLRPTITLRQLPRMLDFAITAESACRALGLPAGAFEAAYQANRCGANDDAIEADTVALAVVQLVSIKQSFIGTATELLQKIDAQRPLSAVDRYWPKDGTRLSGRLRRAAPLLRQRGIEIVFDEKSPDADRRRLHLYQESGRAADAIWPFWPLKRIFYHIVFFGFHARTLELLDSGRSNQMHRERARLRCRASSDR